LLLCPAVSRLISDSSLIPLPENSALDAHRGERTLFARSIALCLVE
jgi:hypothetical protein